LETAEENQKRKEIHDNFYNQIEDSNLNENIDNLNIDVES
jgi:hypothetical protein